MNLEALKEKLSESEFQQLQTHITDLTAQRDFAKQEQITSRKSLKAEVEVLRKTKEVLFDKLGLDDDADLTALEIPTKGAEVEVAKKYERTIKKMEADLAVANADKTALADKYQGTLTQAALQKAISAHDFVDADLVTEYVKARIKFEGDELIYADGDKVLSIDEGVKLLAQTKPHMLKAQGSGGSGFNPNASAGKTKSFADMSLTEKNALYKESPQKYEAMKSGA